MCGTNSARFQYYFQFFDCSRQWRWKSFQEQLEFTIHGETIDFLRYYKNFPELNHIFHSQVHKKNLLLKKDSTKCSNLETDAHYLDHVIMYKDSVESISECCDFCNMNPACNVWSLQLELKRCFLKSTRGARLGDTAYISGFSDKCKCSLLILVGKSLKKKLTHTTSFIFLRLWNHVNSHTDHHGADYTKLHRPVQPQ
jgi:hypothetical protein